MDNCGGHTITPKFEKALQEINTTIRLFLASATDLLQSADSFVIQKLKAVWTKQWDEQKVALLRHPGNERTYESSLGLLRNPGKRFFLQLAANVVREVNGQRDDEHHKYARKAMIRCRLAKRSNGLFEIRQLFRHLQNIISKCRENFDGKDTKSIAEIRESVSA